jgi:DNA-binding transcriptional LysR family regulator
MNQNLSSYWIFYTVANAGNISKAAKELYISQPAISKSIQKLEEGLNCKLFSRSSRGVVLTNEGALLYNHVREAFETLNLGEDKLKRSIELGVGHISIGVSTTLCKYMLLPYLSEFIQRNPHISFSISCQSSNETLRLLEDEKIDIGFIGKSDTLKGYTFDFMGTIEDTFVASPKYLENLEARGISTKDFLSESTLMLLDKTI